MEHAWENYVYKLDGVEVFHTPDHTWPYKQICTKCNAFRSAGLELPNNSLHWEGALETCEDEWIRQVMES